MDPYAKYYYYYYHYRHVPSMPLLHHGDENHRQAILNLCGDIRRGIPSYPFFHVPRHLPFTVEPMRLRRHDDHLQLPRVSIPDDLMEAEILPRLPAKSVLRFRTVSKAWNDMTRSARFAKQHLDHQRSQRSLIMTNIYSVRTMELGSDGTTMVATLVADVRCLFGGVPTLVGSCNGLVCLKSSDGRMVYVCNPIINEFILLPPLIQHFLTSSIQYGIGYDDVNSEFKVLRFVTGWVNKQWGFEAAVYAKQTIGTAASRQGHQGQGSWKILRTVMSDEKRIYDEMVFVDGKLYSDFRELAKRKHCVVSFDVRDERFGEIALPSCMNDERPRRLWELDGCLSCIRWVFDEMVEVWKMKEHGGSQLWTKEHTIFLQVLGDHSPRMWQQWKDDEAIGWSKEHGALVAYNLRSGAVSEPRFVFDDAYVRDPVAGFYSINVRRHAASLFSLKGDRSIQ